MASIEDRHTLGAALQIHKRFLGASADTVLLFQKVSFLSQSQGATFHVGWGTFPGGTFPRDFPRGWGGWGWGLTQGFWSP